MKNDFSRRCLLRGLYMPPNTNQNTFLTRFLSSQKCFFFQKSNMNAIDHVSLNFRVIFWTFLLYFCSPEKQVQKSRTEMSRKARQEKLKRHDKTVFSIQFFNSFEKNVLGISECGEYKTKVQFLIIYFKKGFKILNSRKIGKKYTLIPTQIVDEQDQNIFKNVNRLYGPTRSRESMI